EDSAALLSLVIAGAGLWLSAHTGEHAWDAAASGAIGLLLLAVAIVLAAESHSLLVGERAPAWVERAIRETVTTEPDVAGLAELSTMSLGPRRVLVVLGVRLAPALSSSEVAETLDRLQQRVIDRLDGLTDRRLVVIEPALALSQGAPAYH